MMAIITLFFQYREIMLKPNPEHFLKIDLNREFLLETPPIQTEQTHISQKFRLLRSPSLTKAV